ncbi:MAG: phosphoribosylformylglycinamidine synthase I, partial [Candidatus Aminicenantaceae bacterium]
LVLGICNGFQVLLELNLLPGAILRNKNLKFICKFIHIKLENNATPFTNFGIKNQILKIPVAHFDGSYFASPEMINEIKKNNQITFRYSDEKGLINEDTNVNGSIENIAGLVNKNRNVLGMMPHPERCSEGILGSEDGKIIFKSIINSLKK